MSGDRDAERAAEGSRGKGFLRVPFDSPHRGKLMRMFAVYSIPQLVVYHPVLQRPLTAWGHTAVTFNADHCVRQWHAGRGLHSSTFQLNLSQF